MSEPWKGWMHKSGVAHHHTHICERDGCTPGVWTPIEDESLPHPGDGRQWEELEPWMTTPEPVEIYGMPHEDADGSVWVPVIDSDGDLSTARVDHLRERKPEPEHKEWCPMATAISGASIDGKQVSPKCRCERRSGEERRQGERRKEWPYWVSLADRRHDYGGYLVRAKRGGRSGEDRRQS